MTEFSLTEVLAVAAKMKGANAFVSGSPPHSRVHFEPVELLTSREREIAVNLPDLFIKHMPKLRNERPHQPSTIKSGQLWRSRKSGGTVRVTNQPLTYGRITWERVSGKGARNGVCWDSTLRDKYDYVEG